MEAGTVAAIIFLALLVVLPILWAKRHRKAWHRMAQAIGDDARAREIELARMYRGDDGLNHAIRTEHRDSYHDIRRHRRGSRLDPDAALITATTILPTAPIEPHHSHYNGHGGESAGAGASSSWDSGSSSSCDSGSSSSDSGSCGSGD
jgi:hypothetical protein